MSWVTKEERFVVAELRGTRRSRPGNHGLRKRSLDRRFGREFSGKKSTAAVNRLLADEVLIAAKILPMGRSRRRIVLLTHIPDPLVPGSENPVLYLYDQAPKWYLRMREEYRLT
jgi:hypothetical protein